MTMFDDLIGNPNRHVNNMLHDARWNLILIDHGRTFRAGTGVAFPFDPHRRTCGTGFKS